MEEQRRKCGMRQCRGGQSARQQINALALWCLCSSRVDMRPVDIKAAQVFRAERRRR